MKRISTRMAELRDKADVFHESVPGKLIALFVPRKGKRSVLSLIWMASTRVPAFWMWARGWAFICEGLEALGFTDLRGIDPFLKEETVRSGKVTIQRKYLVDYAEKDFDLITLQHTFEHLPNPKETLQMVYDRLVPGGYCVIRVPVVPNMAFEEYRENWFQIDATETYFHPFGRRHAASLWSGRLSDGGYCV